MTSNKQATMFNDETEVYKLTISGAGNIHSGYYKLIEWGDAIEENDFFEITNIYIENINTGKQIQIFKSSDYNQYDIIIDKATGEVIGVEDLKDEYGDIDLDLMYSKGRDYSQIQVEKVN